MRQSRSTVQCQVEASSAAKSCHFDVRSSVRTSTGEQFMGRISRERDSSASTKKILTPTQVFSKIVNEKVLITPAQSSIEFSRFPHRNLSPEVLNGIANGLFSRNKLENFTRPDPQHLQVDLRKRVDALIEKAKHTKRGKDIQSNKNKLKVVKTSKPGTPQELSARPGSKDISEAHFLNAIHRSRPKPKILTLDNFAEEKLQIQVKDSQASQEQSHSQLKPSRSQGGKLNRAVNQTSIEDFFPRRYRLEARKDREIVDRYLHASRGRISGFNRKSSQHHL
jgi:hypothetical protein